MIMRLSYRAVSMLPVSLFFAIGVAQAGPVSPYSAIYAFGDSLSDVGNAYTATLGAEPAAPYANGQFSNGPVWVQDLATGLGLAPLKPSLLGGTDFAVGGAETGTTPVHTATVGDLLGPLGQITAFQTLNPTANPNALYTIWIGANDLESIPVGSTTPQVAADIAAMVGNIETAIGTLAGDGAKNFLILTVPDLGKTPEATATGPLGAATASAVSAGFDTALASSVTALGTADGLNLKVLDTYSLIDEIVANPGLFGFTNVDSACLTGAVNFAGGTPCAATMAAQDQYLFWDQQHPTAAGHALVADAALAIVTPEPASLALMGTALCGFFLFRRRRG